MLSDSVGDSHIRSGAASRRCQVDSGPVWRVGSASFYDITKDCRSYRIKLVNVPRARTLGYIPIISRVINRRVIRLPA
jgi:hypothetical protein